VRSCFPTRRVKQTGTLPSKKHGIILTRLNLLGDCTAIQPLACKLCQANYGQPMGIFRRLVEPTDSRHRTKQWPSGLLGLCDNNLNPAWWLLLDPQTHHSGFLRYYYHPASLVPQGRILEHLRTRSSSTIYPQLLATPCTAAP
jgi:hypothetical protein